MLNFKFHDPRSKLSRVIIFTDTQDYSNVAIMNRNNNNVDHGHVHSQALKCMAYTPLLTVG